MTKKDDVVKTWAPCYFKDYEGSYDENFRCIGQYVYQI